MKPPFPYFGGKRTIAKFVWRALGQPKHYIEPFFGSGAVLLARPGHDAHNHVETVCDKDGFVANVWRALQADPDAVAKVCDWPVNHADLSARKRRLLENETHLLENLIADEKWYDVELAGYWIWAASCWIGSGLTLIGQRPHISSAGMGVHALGSIPQIGTIGKGINARHNENIYVWFAKLSQRLRHVRVVCGDWTRVCGGNWQDHQGNVGIFFDPPYGVKDRNQDIYHHDNSDIAADVCRWCLERGEKSTYRIVLAGYDEHGELLDHGWTSQAWKSQGGYANLLGKNEGRGKENRHREMLYLSPHCLGDKQKTLFEEVDLRFER